MFSITYEWAQLASVLHDTRLERTVKDNHSSLAGPFVSQEENEVL